MQRSAAIVLQVAVVLIGIVVFAALLYEPTIEGVNANATSLYDIYFDDPFLAYIYFSFIFVFIGLYQAFKLVGNVGRGETMPQKSPQALRTIKRCALVFASLLFLAVAYIVIHMSGSDDIAGGVAVGLFFIVVSLVVAAATALSEQKLRKRIQIN